MEANKKNIQDAELEAVNGGTDYEIFDPCVKCPNCGYYTELSKFIKLPGYSSDDDENKKCPKCGGAWPSTNYDVFQF